MHLGHKLGLTLLDRLELGLHGVGVLRLAFGPPVHILDDKARAELQNKRRTRVGIDRDGKHGERGTLLFCQRPVRAFMEWPR